jgi:type IV pilus assembly protein PilB
MSLLDVLVKKKLIRREDLAALEQELEKTNDFEGVLARHGLSEQDILEAKGEYLGMPFKDLNGLEVPFEILKYIPEESALFYKFVPIGLSDGALEVGFVNPDSMEARDALNFIASKVDLPFRAFLIRQSEFERIVESYRGISGEVTEALSELEKELAARGEKLDLTLESAKTAPKPAEARIIEEAPVTKIVATMLHYATEGNASDIHVEPTGDNVRVRFRVDGALSTSLVLPSKINDAVVARIKVLSNMRLDEKRKPQDGRFSARIEGRKIDFRVSTFPTYYGEKVVMRILDTQKGVKSLDNMGLSADNLAKIKEAIHRPFGLILISGPTGSGKSTSLYSMLKELDFETDNIISLEDPVEYNIPGMNQSQVRPEIGYTFASGLRSILRQDPDIIMVGEIRDKETAQLAVQAALTGHLVLSTIHTNDVVGVIPRLIDMGVDPFLIAPTLIMAIAQRLVNLLCSKGKPLPIEGSIKLMIDREFQGLPEATRRKIAIPRQIYEAAPSADCPKGTRGRTAVFEVLMMNRELEQVILKNPTETEIVRVARQQGMLTIKEDAILKAFNGEVPFEEVNKL